MYRSLKKLGRSRKAIATTIITLSLSCILALLPLRPSAAISITDVPNPQHVDGTWVSDMADLIDPATEAKINQAISELEAETGAEMAVVTVLETQSFASPKSFATELFNTWGIGKAGEDNGVLFLVSKGDRRTEVETGYGIEGVLTDAKVGNILDTRVTPQFKAGNFGQGILSGTQAMSAAIKGENFNEPLAEVIPVPQSQPAPSAHSARPSHNGHTSHRARAQDTDRLTWFSKFLWVLVLCSIVPAVVFFKRLRQGKIPYELQPVQISPVGASQQDKIASPWMYLWAVTCAGRNAGALGSTGQYISLWDFGGRYKWNEQLAEHYGWLTTHHRNQQFKQRSLILFSALFLLSLSGALSFSIMLIQILAACSWLCYEILLSKRTNKNHASLSVSISSAILSFVKIFGVVIIILFLIIFLGVASGGLFWMLSPFLIVAVIGTTAGLIRVLRTSTTNPKVTCKTCDHAMKKLTSTDLLLHITTAQKAEISIGSKAGEGWHCPTCVPVSQHSNLDRSEFRLFLFRRKKPGITTCRSCRALTLEVTTQVISAATTRHSGKKRVTRHCHCCGFHKEKMVTIPRKSSSSSSSSYGSSYSSGSSSSSSSSGSSGGSFGGGSSGGGGAGSSW